MTNAESPVTPEMIMKVAGGFMASKHLFVASSIDLFAAMADGPATLDELAAKTGVPRRTVRITADAMAALGFVEKHGQHYKNGPAADTFLAGKTPADLRPFLKFWDRISYPKWMGLETSIRTAVGVEQGRRINDEEARIFSEGVAAISAGSANALIKAYDWSRHQRLLDLGGGTGSFLAAALGAHENLTGSLFELPEAAAVARKFLAGKPVGKRIEIVEGSFLELPIPHGHDVVLLANVVHVLSPQHNLDLFRRVRSAVTPGARLLLVDFWLDASHTDPVFAALMAGEFLVLTGEGDSYSDDEARAWLAETGWKAVDKKSLAGPASLVVAEAF